MQALEAQRGRAMESRVQAEPAATITRNANVARDHIVSTRNLSVRDKAIPNQIDTILQLFGEIPEKRLPKDCRLATHQTLSFHDYHHTTEPRFCPIDSNSCGIVLGDRILYLLLYSRFWMHHQWCH
jgi:hypothetical protein